MKNTNNNHGEISEQELQKKLQAAQEIRLTDEQKDRMETFLSHYVGLHPVLGEQERILRKRRARYSQMNVLIRFAPAFMLVLFFFGGGIAFAERALPGNMLYGVKVATENVRESLAMDTEARARLGTKMIQRRISEAYQLASDGTVKEENAEELISRFKENMLDLHESLEKLKQEKGIAAFEIEHEYQSTIRMNRDMFVRMSNENEGMQRLLERVAVEFGLPVGYFGGGNVAMADTGAEMSLMSVATEDSIDEANGEEEAGTAVEPVEEMEVLSFEGGAETPPALLRTAVAEEPVQEKLSLDVEQSLSLETLELYVGTRIEKTESLLKSARKLEKDLERKVKEMIEESEKIYEAGKKARGAGNEAEARASFIASADILEDARTVIRVSKYSGSTSLLKLLLEAPSERREAPREEDRNEEPREDEGEGESEEGESERGEEESREGAAVLDSVLPLVESLGL